MATIKNLTPFLIDSGYFVVEAEDSVEVDDEVVAAFRQSPAYRHLCGEPFTYVEVVEGGGRRRKAAAPVEPEPEAKAERKPRGGGG